MLSGFLDDRSVTSWGEYLKGFLDMLISVAASVVLYYGLKNSSADGVVSFWEHCDNNVKHYVAGGRTLLMNVGCGGDICFSCGASCYCGRCGYNQCNQSGGWC